jgi:DNA-binding transcriptional LysR family regulator
MEVHQLRYFTAIADEGSFTAAAARLQVSQSGVSTQLAKLERELGQDLFTRGRTIGLTPVGEALLPLARDVLAGLDTISATAGEFAGAVRGTVRLGAIPGCTIPGFLDVVAGLRRTHPGIVLHVTEGTATQLHRGVLNNTLDIALTGYAGESPADVDTWLIREERLVAFASHDLALPPKPTLSEIQQHIVLCLAPGSGIRSAYERACERSGLTPRVDIEASSPLTLLGLAERSGGIAVLPSTTVVGATLLGAQISDALTPACLGLISRQDQKAPAVRVVLGKLTAALVPDPGGVENVVASNA